jgi:hypothetical protein
MSLIIPKQSASAAELTTLHETQVTDVGELAPIAGRTEPANVATGKLLVFSVCHIDSRSRDE